VNADAKRLWVEALRSGDYQQGQGALSTLSSDGGGTRFCCLGVACEVAIANGVPVEKKSTPSGSFSSYNAHVSFLPPAVAEWLGIDDAPTVIVNSRRRALDALNDGGRSFDAIADLIEAQL